MNSLNLDVHILESRLDPDLVSLRRGIFSFSIKTDEQDAVFQIEGTAQQIWEDLVLGKTVGEAISTFCLAHPSVDLEEVEDFIYDLIEHELLMGECDEG